MRHHTRPKSLILMLALGAVLAAGCSAPPPCEVTPAQVDAARAEQQAAQSAAESAAAERKQLEGQIADLQSKLVTDDEIADLEQHLTELKKGSGR